MICFCVTGLNTVTDTRVDAKIVDASQQRKYITGREDVFSHIHTLIESKSMCESYCYVRLHDFQMNIIFLHTRGVDPFIVITDNFRIIYFYLN